MCGVRSGRPCLPQREAPRCLVTFFWPPICSPLLSLMESSGRSVMASCYPSLNPVSDNLSSYDKLVPPLHGGTLTTGSQHTFGIPVASRTSRGIVRARLLERFTQDKGSCARLFQRFPARRPSGSYLSDPSYHRAQRHLLPLPSRPQPSTWSVRSAFVQIEPRVNNAMRVLPFWEPHFRVLALELCIK
jgi:hypothetical protein